MNKYRIKPVKTGIEVSKRLW